MKIGLTGSIACGKTTVCDHLRALGYPVVDADAISRAMTAPGGPALPLLREAFGESIFQADGALDRRALGAIVFSDSAQRERLNGILHPMILREIADSLSRLEREHPVVFADVPLLHECGMGPMFDSVWTLALPHETQLQRLMARDGIDREAAESRIAAQMPLSQKIRLSDEVISTEGSIEETRRQVDRLLEAQRRRA